jgi:hypothetical protein
VYAKRVFYRAVVYLSSSKFAILAGGNMGLVSFLLAWRAVQAVFLGPLRFREVERLHLRARDAIIECCFALTIFREEFNARFLALVTTLLLLKSMHWLCKDRIEFLEEQPLTPTSGHMRLVGLMTLLFAVDAKLVVACSLYTIRSPRATMLVLFAFEFTVLLIDLVSNVVRYILHVIDLYMDSRWDGKGLYSFYNELLSDMCQLTVYVAFFAYVQFFYTFPLHIMRDLYVTFTKFQKRCVDFMRYRRVVATMNELFADATEEELAEGDRTCIICREEMRAAKKLNCGHMFHVRCLQSWLKRQLSCPTCRSAVDVSESATPAGANRPGQAGAGQDDAGNNNNNNNAQAANNGAARPPLPPWAGFANQGPPGGRAAPGRPAMQQIQQAGGREAGILAAVNAWWQALIAGVAPQNGQQPARQLPRLGPRYFVARMPANGPWANAGQPGQLPQGPPAAAGRQPPPQHAHPAHPLHPMHPFHPANPAHPAYPLHQMYYHYPHAYLNQQTQGRRPPPPTAAGDQAGATPHLRAPIGTSPPHTADSPNPTHPASGSLNVSQSSLRMPEMLLDTDDDDDTYRVSLDRLVQLQESVEVIAANVERIEPIVAALRTQVRETLLAATAPRATPPSAATPATLEPAPQAAPEATPGRAAPAYPIPESTTPKTSPATGDAQASSGAAASRSADPVSSEADQLRQRRLQFLERTASHGSSSSNRDGRNLTESEE